MNSLLQPFRDPGEDLAPVFRCTDVTLAVWEQTVDVKGGDVRYPQPGVDRNGDEIREILPGPLVLVIRREPGFRWVVVCLSCPANWSFPILCFARLEHSFQFVVAERSAILVAGICGGASSWVL